MTTSPQKPIDTLRDGSIKATIWANQTSKGKTFHSVTITRTYRVGEKFKETASFGANELLKAANIANRAYDRINQLRAEIKEAESDTQH